MSLKLTPMAVRRLLGPLDIFGSMTGTSWAHSSEGMTHLQLPPPSMHTICDNTVGVKNNCSKSSSVSYLEDIVIKHQLKDCVFQLYSTV